MPLRERLRLHSHRSKSKSPAPTSATNASQTTPSAISATENGAAQPVPSESLRPSGFRPQQKPESQKNPILLVSAEADVGGPVRANPVKSSETTPGNPQLSNDLWDEAYDNLLQQDPKTIAAYEDFLNRTSHNGADKRKVLTDISSASSIERQKRLKQVLDTQHDLILKNRWAFDVGGKHIEIKEEVKRIAGAVIWAADFISAAASNEPHAALAWAGVSVLLPSLINSIEQDKNAVQGLDYIRQVILRYNVLEKVYLREGIQDADADISEQRGVFRTNTIQLYSFILGYQIRLASQRCRKAGIRLLRDTFISDDWKEMLDQVKTFEDIGERTVVTLDREAFNSAFEIQSRQIGRIIQRQSEEKSEKNAERVNGWLERYFNSRMDDNHDRHCKERRYKDSGKWFTDEVVSWLKGESNMIFWNRGIPGVGKSVLISGMVQMVADHMTDLPIDGFAYVYFQWDQRTDQGIREIYASILRKLRSSSTRLSESVEALYEKHLESNTSPDASALGDILTGHRQQASQPNERFLLIFDALDEASPETRSTLVKRLRGLDTNIFRVLITSRDDLEIDTGEDMTKVGRIEKADASDVGRCIRVRLQELRRDIRNDKTLLNELTIAICRQAQGIFLSASLHVVFVASIGPINKMKDAANRSFTLEDMYAKTITQIKSLGTRSDNAFKALAWLTWTKRNMSLQELQYALAVEPGSTCIDEGNAPPRRSIPQICRGFVTFDKSTQVVRLTHQTVQEYLRSLDQIQELKATITVACFLSLTLPMKARPSTRKTLPRHSSTPDPVYSDEEGQSINSNESGGDDDDTDDQEFLVLLNTSEASTTTFDDCEDSDEDLATDMRTLLPPTIDRTARSSPRGSQIGLEQSDLEEFDDGCSPSGEVENDVIYGKYNYEFSRGYNLELWAAARGPFADYSGSYAVDHFSDLVNTPAMAVDAVWTFLTERPSKRLLSSLLDGNNAYPAKFSPLHMAAVIGDVRNCERLLQEGIDINLQDSCGSTALMYAVRDARVALIDMLLKRSADYSIVNDDGQLAFQMAERDLPKLHFQRLIPRGGSFNQDTLHKAATSGLCNLITTILDLGLISVNALDRSGDTALMSAAESGELDAVRILCSNGADINRADYYGWTALHRASRRANYKVVQCLLTEQADPNRLNSTSSTPLLEATEGLNENPEKDVRRVVKLLLQRKVLLNCRNFWGATALRIASGRYDGANVISLLLDAGADIHVSDDGGLSPFHCSVIHCPGSAVFDLLFEAETRFAAAVGEPAKAAYTDPNGNTALHHAARTSYVSMTKKILGIPDIDIDRPNAAGRPAIQCALHAPGVLVFKALLDAGARIDMVDSGGISLLDSAIMAELPDMVGLLVQRACRPNFAWDTKSDSIRVHQNESWFPLLLDLFATTNAADPVYDLHLHESREEEAIIRPDDIQPYLEISIPGQESYLVRRVKFCTVSHDQGWSDPHNRLHWGTYIGSCTCFEAWIKRRGSRIGGHKREIQVNVHASTSWKTHINVWDFRSKEPGLSEWLGLLRPGDTIVLSAKAHYPGWRNYVKSARVDVFCEIDRS